VCIFMRTRTSPKPEIVKTPRVFVVQGVHMTTSIFNANSIRHRISLSLKNTRKHGAIEGMETTNFIMSVSVDRADKC
jgi:hypothetical protein